MTTNGAVQDRAADIEAALIGGDLTALSPEERVQYYRQVCQSLGVNYLTQPFAYIVLNGRLTLYAKKDAADQLRRLNHISIDKPDIQFENEWIIVTVVGRTPDGRSDADIGVVSRKDMRGDFGNALMKAVTKAKRRVTLSICGLGWLDETEVETIPEARVFTDATATVEAPAARQLKAPEDAARGAFWATVDELKLRRATEEATRLVVHAKLGLPREEGSLRDWVAEHGGAAGWQAAQALLRTGHTVAAYAEAAVDGDDLPWDEAPAELAP